MVKTETFDAAPHLTTREAQTDLLNDALASGDASYVSRALGVIARARGMTDVARHAGITPETLDLALSDTGDPLLTTLLEAGRQARLAWEADGIATAEASLAAGLYVDADDIDAWIDSLGTDHELPPPPTRHR